MHLDKRIYYFLVTFETMFEHKTSVRVRYSETDKMGYCYYGNYAQFLEIGRVEALRELGFPYKELEDSGVMLPVADLSIRYLKPAVYDDELIITTRIIDLSAFRITFDYEIRNKEDEKLTEATTTLVFVNDKTMKPTKHPKEMSEKLKKYI